MAFWPFGKFRVGQSDLSGKKLITILPDNARYPIYTSKEWWSDVWGATEYAQEYDPSRSFFEQWKELQEKVPRPHQQGAQNTDCDWCDDAWSSKNCYLSRSLKNAENIMYGYRAIDSKDSLDVSHVFNLDQCYDCTYCFKSSQLFFSKNCRDCIDSSFLFDCRNLSNCFMCWNLRNKSYCIENVQYTKEEYQEKMKEINLGSHDELQKFKRQYSDIIKNSTVHREHFNIKAENSTGSYMTECNDCVDCFSWEKSENCTNCLRGLIAKDVIDLTGCWEIEASGNNSCCTGSYDLKYSIWCDNARYSEYCDQCLDVEYCFGCVGMRKKKYCILNKQYTEEEYKKLRASIIADMEANGEYGMFAPYNMGLCPYNLTTAAIYFSEVGKKDIEKQGGYWNEVTDQTVDGLTTDSLPDNIADVDNEVSRQALTCPVTGWRYNIADAELSFLKQHNIALPRVHFDVRTKDRMDMFSQTKSEPYTCTFCEKDIMAYYAKDWEYKRIACIDCYQKEIS
jgi:hypothetical protein